MEWPEAIKPLLKKYKGHKHPLEYKNFYQLIVLVVLSAQDTDKNINALAPELFKAYPDFTSLAKATPAKLYPYVRVRNFANKTKWLLEIAETLKDDKHIPQTLDELTALPGIGRKSALVILRESGRPPEGVIVDLHVVRVAPRLGIAAGTDPKKIEKQIMEILPPKEWDAGMAMSFLGRDVCRPKPKCEECLMRNVCAYYANLVTP
ncbi:endonuclease III domain-containing protein [Dinghuibacter silviterrae]|uniref:Endonuclease-3 n=1 Tax=Dinghuibacter silviterrae TaxID=1539049 RepID=A0A4R8DG34_9BACT|nr:endonuclease III [Dinghuibacter silviterrae]TDW96066.1 endonuclease-3 [Dinghuibacter silviterrae]